MNYLHDSHIFILKYLPFSYFYLHKKNRLAMRQDGFLKNNEEFTFLLHWFLTPIFLRGLFRLYC